MTLSKTSPATRERSWRVSDEGEGDRVGTLHRYATGRPDHPHPPLRGDLSRKRERFSTAGATAP
jgi:hypothetical protein